MPTKRKKSVLEGNMDFLIGKQGAKPRSGDGKFASNPLTKLTGKKKK